MCEIGRIASGWICTNFILGESFTNISYTDILVATKKGNYRFVEKYLTKVSHSLEDSYMERAM